MERMNVNPTRRRFLGSLCAATTVVAVPHASYAIMLARPTVGEIVGHGKFRYRVDKHWGIQDPARVPVRNCHEMVRDRHGRLYMTTTHTKNNVIVYDKSGVVLDTWGETYPGIHGLTMAQEGTEEFLFFTDIERHLIFKTTKSGKELMKIECPLESGVYRDCDQFMPTEIAVADDGSFYVADGYGENYIIKFDSHGRYVMHFGGRGSEDHQFDCCHGITIDRRDRANPTLLITSRSAQEFKRFTLDGQYLETYKTPGCWICRPVVDRDNLYFAVLGTKSWWEYDGMLLVLDRNNRIVSAPGARTEQLTSAPLDLEYDGRTFMNPHDVCIDGDENLYVPQWFSGNSYPIKLERI